MSVFAAPKSYDLAEASNAVVALLCGRIKVALGEIESGLTSLIAAERLNCDSASINVHLGGIYLRLRRWSEAQNAFEKAVILDEDCALGWQGLSTVHRRMHRTRKRSMRPCARLACSIVCRRRISISGLRWSELANPRAPGSPSRPRSVFIRE
ncbi:MAG: hypothetical protein ACR2HH_04915 [Chthoniobacterales bacterium]